MLAGSCSLTQHSNSSSEKSTVIGLSQLKALLTNGEYGSYCINHLHAETEREFPNQGTGVRTEGAKLLKANGVSSPLSPPLHPHQPCFEKDHTDRILFLPFIPSLCMRLRTQQVHPDSLCCHRHLRRAGPAAPHTPPAGHCREFSPQLGPRQAPLHSASPPPAAATWGTAKHCCTAPVPPRASVLCPTPSESCAKSTYSLESHSRAATSGFPKLLPEHHLTSLKITMPSALSSDRNFWQQFNIPKSSLPLPACLFVPGAANAPSVQTQHIPGRCQELTQPGDPLPRRAPLLPSVGTLQILHSY